MRRREVALGLAGLASLSVLPVRRAAVQDAARLPKVAILSPMAPSDIAGTPNALNSLLTRLSDLGYVDGENR